MRRLGVIVTLSTILLGCAQPVAISPPVTMPVYPHHSRFIIAKDGMHPERVIVVPEIWNTQLKISSHTINECPTLIKDALGDVGCAISFCESQWNSEATGAAGERGWFQIHPRWHPDATYDPAGNVAAAVRISSGGTDWSAWTCRFVLV